MKLLILNKVFIIFLMTVLMLFSLNAALKLELNRTGTTTTTMTTAPNLVLNTQKVYDKLIKKYENQMNSVRLGNYLRKLLLQVILALFKKSFI